MPSFTQTGREVAPAASPHPLAVVTPHPRCRAGAARQAAAAAEDLADVLGETLGLHLLADAQRGIARQLGQHAETL